MWDGKGPYERAAALLPARLAELALTLPAADQYRAEELRLRRGRPLTVTLPEGERSLGGGEVTGQDLERLVELVSRCSYHAVAHRMAAGYITAPGGFRVGLCGGAVMERGEIRTIHPISSANVRIARQVRGAARSILGRLCPGGRLTDTLILAPPGMGKTTLLRDLFRAVSEGENCTPQRVALMDERGEVASLYNGCPQMDVGCCTDVLEGCPKGEGLLLLLRAMNPQVLAADEITAPADGAALARAAGCGVTLLATAHGSGREDLERRGLYRSLLEEGLFRRLVTIRCRDGIRDYEVEELPG